MQLTDCESAVLEALSNRANGQGEYVDVEAVAAAIGDHAADEVRRALHGLETKQFVELDGAERAAITEMGIAAIGSM